MASWCSALLVIPRESSFIGFAGSALEQIHREGEKLVKTWLIDGLQERLTLFH